MMTAHRFFQNAISVEILCLKVTLEFCTTWLLLHKTKSNHFYMGLA